MSKHRSLDKYDAHIPKKAHWIQDDGYVSRYNENFHSVSYYGYDTKMRFSRTFGVSKKLWNVSSHGIEVDSQYIGKSDNE